MNEYEFLVPMSFKCYMAKFNIAFDLIFNSDVYLADL